MNRILTVLTLVVASLLVGMGTAQAASLEKRTRADAGIPAHAVKRVPSYDTFTPGTKFRPEGTRCYTSRTTKRVRVQGRMVPKNRLLQYCTDRYVDERRAARTFVRYLRNSQFNAAERAEENRLTRLCESLGGVYQMSDCRLPDGTYIPLAGL